ncbi:MAG: response regulator [Geobacteraceae bacterium]|nr:MAG: response regulator [Geobacteraceae bacterium]
MEPSQHSSPAISILIVEDDKVTHEVLGLMIPKKFPDVTIYSSANGRMGVELFKEHAPGIVITDIQMPDMDGIEMAGEIKAIKPDTKFIVVTAYGNTSYYEKFNKIGFHDFLSKPIEFNKLYAAIEKCIAEIANNQAEP